MLKINPKDIPVSKLHGYILGAIGPRPIALASTIGKDGSPNLSPFSFFNAFSANPPVCVFSPARRGRNNTAKDTFENVKEVPEVVINVVNHALVQQCSLSSTEYPKGVNEFIKAGLTQVESEMVKPFRVKESPVQMECKVRDVIELGDQAGAGSLVICEILLMHINDDILNEAGAIDQQKIDLVARMGGNWYCRASGDSLFEVEKPLLAMGIGVDGIHPKIRNSTVLTGNNLAQLGNVETLPPKDEIVKYKDDFLNDIFSNYTNTELEKQLHLRAKELLSQNKVAEAWKTLLSVNNQ